MQQPLNEFPLCIDLDGTLVNTDLFLESILRTLRHAPWTIFLMPFWLLGGRQRLKAQLARYGRLIPESLPYNEAVLELIEAARSTGRTTVLVTGSNRVLAEHVSAHLELFDELHASDDETNLTGPRKAKRLAERFGMGRFEYAGNSAVDLPVWEHSGSIVTVNAPAGVVRKARALGKPHEDIPSTPATLKDWLRCIRIHQWAKNALIFVPMLTAHAVLDPGAWIAAGLAFVCFGLIASATYIVNDLLDLDADRQHRTKRFRPIAAGRIPIHAAGLVSVFMLAGGLSLSLLLPWAFSGALLVYLVTTLLYSFRLKRIASLDILTLAGLYTLRIIAGALAVGVEISFWLLAFSMFVFLCLAIVKRVAELLELDVRTGPDPEAEQKAQGREYDTGDLAILQSLGTSSGYLAILVLALYINSPEVSRLYRTPELLWLVVPLALLWVTRIWMTTARGMMHEDPVVFAIKDPKTWITGALAAIIVVAAAVLDLRFF